MDRNNAGADKYNSVLEVALLAEGVDRNALLSFSDPDRKRSPSSRRAWIEMPVKSSGHFQGLVALLAEGVDRNHFLEAV